MVDRAAGEYGIPLELLKCDAGPISQSGFTRGRSTIDWHYAFCPRYIDNSTARFMWHMLT